MYTLNKSKNRVVQCKTKNGKRVYSSGRAVPKTHRCYRLKSDANKSLRKVLKRKSVKRRPVKRRTTKRSSKSLYTVYCRQGKKCAVYPVKTAKGADGKQHRFIVVTVDRCKRVLCLDKAHRCYRKKSDATKKARVLNSEPFRCKEFARDHRGVLYSKVRSKNMIPRLGKDCNGNQRLRTVKVNGRKVHRPVSNTMTSAIRGFDRSALRKTGRNVNAFGRRLPLRFGSARPMNYGFRRFI